jgi:glycosyltransferase involved in cell wall biosynthesis
MKQKLYRLTTISCSFNELLKGQLAYMNNYYDVTAVASDTGTLNEVGREQGVTTINIPMAREISPWQDVKSLVALYKLFRRDKPHIVHVNTPKASLLGMVAAWLARVPKRVYTVTGLRFETTSGLLRFTLKSMERITCLCATRVVPEGDGVRDTLRRERITNKPLKKIHNGNINGIDLHHYDRTQEVIDRANILSSNKFTFLFVGRIVKDKGVNELVSAFDKLSSTNNNIRLVLVGRFEDKLDPISAESRDIIERNPDIVVAGYQKDVRPYIAASDILVLPSYREGFPNVVLQAGAMGLPCIVTDINGCNEIIIDGENGTIIPPQNVDALYEAMNEAVTNPNKISSMANIAREMVASRYEQREVWQATLEMYNTL